MTSNSDQPYEKTSSTYKDGTKTETIRIATPRGRRKPRVSVIVSPSDVMPDVLNKHVGGFVTFLREHAIVGLAVGLVIGTQVKALVDQLITSFISPIVGFLIGGGKTLNERSVTLHIGHRPLILLWGAFMYALIDFISIMATVYAIIKFFKLDQLDKKKE